MASTGVEGLDRLLKKGYSEKSAILVVGPPPPGSGEQILYEDGTNETS